MDPITISFVLAAGKFVIDSLPALRDAINGGALSEADEQAARDVYTNYRALGGAKYSGPDYDLSGR